MQTSIILDNDKQIDFICSKATQMLSFELNLTLFSLSLDILFAPFSRCIDKLQVCRQQYTLITQCSFCIILTDYENDKPYLVGRHASSFHCDT